MELVKCFHICFIWTSHVIILLPLPLMVWNSSLLCMYHITYTDTYSYIYRYAHTTQLNQTQAYKYLQFYKTSVIFGGGLRAWDQMLLDWQRYTEKGHTEEWARIKWIGWLIRYEEWGGKGDSDYEGGRMRKSPYNRENWLKFHRWAVSGA